MFLGINKWCFGFLATKKYLCFYGNILFRETKQFLGGKNLLGEKAVVEIWGKNAYLKLESGGEALVPVEELCRLAKRFNLKLENYQCEQDS